MIESLIRNLSAGTRLAFFLPVRWRDFQVGATQYAVLAGFNLLLWFVFSTLRDSQGTLNVAAITMYLGQIPLLLIACLAIAAIYRNPAIVLLLAVGLSASDLAFELVGLVLTASGQGTLGQLLGFGAFLGWAWIVSLRAIAICAGAQRPQFLYASGVISALIAGSLFVLPHAELWVPAQQEAPAPGLTREKTFHAQGEVIERELAALEAGRIGITELYFVGFAPDGSQDVFLREMRSVKQILDRRFGTGGRSLALISSESAIAAHPLATLTNLKRALGKVAERMNVDEDVLFLYVTAHGDERFELSGYAPPLVLERVNPTVLSRALQDAGIKWKVLVISACYSGGFIEPLKDDNTLIITAAAPDRQSFGCENGNDWTYFGEAYFKQALGRTRSFIEAFALAAEAVASREAAEQLSPPSNPAMFAGREIAQKLRQLALPPDS